MLLNPQQARGARERGRSWPATSFDSADFVVSGPVALEADVHKEQADVPDRGACRHDFGADLSRCASLPGAGAFDLRLRAALQEYRAPGGRGPRGREEEREVEEDDLTTAYYRDETIHFGCAPGARAVLPRAADEAALCGGLQGTVRALRSESEPGRLRLPPGLAGPAVRSVEGLEEGVRPFRAAIRIIKCRIPNDVTPKCGPQSGGRTHDALKPVPLGECPQCHEAKPPHQVCPNCGYYKGRQVKEVDEV